MAIPYKRALPGLGSLKILWLVIVRKAVILNMPCKLAGTPDHEKHPGIGIAKSGVLTCMPAIDR